MAQTPPSLLNRLRESPSDSDAWRRFDAIYRPLLLSWLRRYALQSHDSDDLVQEILQAVLAKLPTFHYDPARGRFRDWLRKVMVNRLLEFWRIRKRDATLLEPFLNQLQDPSSDLSRLWDREHDQHVLKGLLAQLEPDFASTTWQAFHRLLAGEKPETIAASLNLSREAVYLAKHRILKRLQELAHDLID